MLTNGPREFRLRRAGWRRRRSRGGPDSSDRPATLRSAGRRLRSAATTALPDGSRFSANAVGPSRASSVPIRARISWSFAAQASASAGTAPSRMPLGHPLAGLHRQRCVRRRSGGRARAPSPAPGPRATTSLTSPQRSAVAASIGSTGQDHLHRDLARQLLGESDQAPGRGDQSAAHLGEAEGRGVRRDREVGGEHQLGAAAERGAVDRGDHRLADRVVHHPGEPPRLGAGRVQALAPSDRLEVRAGAEGRLAGGR